jgi:hypothetical protein
MNNVARRKDYAIKETKQGIFILPNGGASSWMMLTGLLIVLFSLPRIFWT